MSKIYKKYISSKVENSELLYIFKCDNSYVLLDEDAKLISHISDLKLNSLNSIVLKCEFTFSDLNKYIEIIKRNNLSFQIIDFSSNSSYMPYESTLEFKIKSLLNKIAFVDSKNLSIKDAYEFINNISSDSKILLEDLQENNSNKSAI